jgi:hypothetical protein
MDKTTRYPRFIRECIGKGLLMSRIARNLSCLGACALFLAGSAHAQLLGGLPLPRPELPVRNLPVSGPMLDNVLGSEDGRQAIRPTLHTVQGVSERIARSGAATLLELRRQRLSELVRENQALLDTDDDGAPIRRGVLLVIDAQPASLQRAIGAGFRLLGEDRNDLLGISSARLAPPPGMSSRAGLKRLRRLAPDLEVDFEHLFEPAGTSLLPIQAALASASSAGLGRSIGMVDGGVASHPSLSGATIEQNGFAGAPQPTGHGTAVASLLVGNHSAFRGAATGARLYVADVYGGSRAAGSASAIVKALGWLASRRPAVINISLVGPSNKLVERAIRAVQSRGIQVVAAVGNDGPAAPPQFPASYPGVIAITGVDARGRALPEAGRATHVDFAAPGADMAAALPGQGYTRVRGTSFAAPLAAARLLALGSLQRLTAEASRGSGRIGHGIVCAVCRVDPRAVGAK